MYARQDDGHYLKDRRCQRRRPAPAAHCEECWRERLSDDPAPTELCVPRIPLPHQDEAERPVRLCEGCRAAFKAFGYEHVHWPREPHQRSALPRSLVLFADGPSPELGTADTDQVLVEAPDSDGEVRITVLRTLRGVSYADLERYIEHGRLLPAEGAGEIVAQALAEWQSKAAETRRGVTLIRRHGLGSYLGARRTIPKHLQLLKAE